MENYIEKGPERIPTKEEILDIINELTEGKEFLTLREKSDESGLYLLEVQIDEDIPDDTTRYEYRRKGIFPEGKTSETVINIERYEGDMCVAGHNIADYDPTTGEWKFSK